MTQSTPVCRIPAVFLLGSQDTSPLNSQQLATLYVLNKAGFKAVSDDALVLRLPDEPGALAVVAGNLKEAGVNIESLHILTRGSGHTMIALKTDNRTEAIAAIGSENIF